LATIDLHIEVQVLLHTPRFAFYAFVSHSERFISPTGINLWEDEEEPLRRRGSCPTPPISSPLTSKSPGFPGF